MFVQNAHMLQNSVMCVSTSDFKRQQLKSSHGSNLAFRNTLLLSFLGIFAFVFKLC